MESGRTMVFHALLIGTLLYLFMVFVLGQPKDVSENRSILFASIILAYMILFGHGFPTSVNKKLFV